jgi:hypothetical protein
LDDSFFIKKRVQDGQFEEKAPQEDCEAQAQEAAQSYAAQEQVTFLGKLRNFFRSFFCAVKLNGSERKRTFCS